MKQSRQNCLLNRQANSLSFFPRRCVDTVYSLPMLDNNQPCLSYIYRKYRQAKRLQVDLLLLLRAHNDLSRSLYSGDLFMSRGRPSAGRNLRTE